MSLFGKSKSSRSKSSSSTSFGSSNSLSQRPFDQNDLRNYSVYIVLNARRIPGTYHWGIFIPTGAPYGHVWHAIDNTPNGSWKLETKETGRVVQSRSLALLFEVAHLTSATWKKAQSVLDSVPAKGAPSPYTGESFTCRVWVKIALQALHNTGAIKLEKSVEDLEKEVTGIANRRTGARVDSAVVINNFTTSSSSTSSSGIFFS